VGKLDPIRESAKKGGGIVEFSRVMKPGALTGIDASYYKRAYPEFAVVYGLYPMRDPEPANLAPMRDGDFNCIAQKLIEYFEGALRG
jgi:hypothetical protein